MSPHGRIPCINPNCRRTADAAKFAAGEEIICGKCWKALPKRLTARYRALRNRSRQIDRIIRKRRARGEIHNRAYALHLRLDRLCEANGRLIKAYFTNPAAEPAGLENFLKETGLA